jgi:hypothetical protein
MPTRRKLAGRSVLAQVAHFRTGAGEMGGTRKIQARRRRREAKDEEREAIKKPVEVRRDSSE